MGVSNFFQPLSSHYKSLKLINLFQKVNRQLNKRGLLTEKVKNDRIDFGLSHVAITFILRFGCQGPTYGPDHLDQKVVRASMA